MAHFNLVKTDDIMNGPVDYSSPVGSTAIYVCSLSVDEAMQNRRPAGKKFTANDSVNRFWFNKFCHHTDTFPDFVKYARGKSGTWYVEAAYL